MAEELVTGAQQQPSSGERRGPSTTLSEYLESFLVTVLLALFVTSFVVQAFKIPSASMEGTLLIGDHLFVNRFIYAAAPTALERALLPSRTPRRGDIVIFRSPEKPTVDLVKRCVGLPGDSIQITNKRLYVNGRRVEDAEYTRHRDPRVFPSAGNFPEQALKRDNFGPVQVPPGHYFCMGDNRDYSADSRFWGPLPVGLVKGKAMFRYFSWDGDRHWVRFSQILRPIS